MHRIPVISSLLLGLVVVGCAAPPSAPKVVIAHSPMREAEAWGAIGRSVEGRAIEARTIGSGPLRVYLIASIHGDEPEGAAHLDELLEGLAEGGDAEGATLRVVADMNPDGRAAETRSNARGVDLNRNWPTPNFEPRARHGERALSEPETEAVLKDLERFDPEIVIVLHSSTRGPFVNFDGPARREAEAFAEAASEHGQSWSVEPSIGYPTPGSLGTWAGEEREIPILTIEYERGQDERLALREGVAGLRAVLKAAQREH